jgi:hypothetical protein
MPGQINAKIPNSSAKSPRSAIQCQARAKFASIGPAAIFFSFAAVVHPKSNAALSVWDEPIGSFPAEARLANAALCRSSENISLILPDSVSGQPQKIAFTTATQNR